MKTLKKLFSVSAIVALLGTLAPMYAFGATYTAELEEAYNYAYKNGITTMTSIDNANMFGSLTRIAMAKMIANYATTVLGLEPDTSAKCTFTDVTAALDAQYDNGVTKACQLGLMGQNITAFRPNDPVTRAEFGTTLSRALNSNDADKLAEMNAADPYYKEHLNFLKNEGIMTQIDNPSMTEVRGYVMLMMMRADESYTPAEGCTAEELLACTVADDIDACMAACNGDEGEEEEQDPETGITYGKVTVSKATFSETSVPSGIPGVAMGKIKVKAGEEDAKLSSITLKANGYGNYANLDSVYLEDEDGNRVTRQRNVDTDGNVTLDFVSNYDLKANSSVTFSIVNTINGGTNGDTYGYTVTEVTGPEKVTGLPISTDLVSQVTISNLGKLDIAANLATADVKIGREEKLGSFKLSQSNGSQEDVRLYSVVVKQDGDVDMDDLSDLYISIAGEKVTSKARVDGKFVTLTFKDGGYVIEKDKASAVTLNLMGTVTGSPAKTTKFIIEREEDIVAKGERHGYRVDLLNAGAPYDLSDFALSNALKIEGSEIEASFDKSEDLTTLATTDSFSFGNLKLKASDTNYEFETLIIELTTNVDYATVAALEQEVRNVKLGDMTATSVTRTAAKKFEYKFEGISMNKGVQRNLPLTMKLYKVANATQTFAFDLSLKNNKFKLVDLDADKTYDTVAGVTNIMSTTTMSTNTVSIAGGKLTLTVNAMNPNSYVTANGKDIVVAKGKLEAGNNTDIKVTSMTFTQGGSLTTLSDFVSKAVLTVDGEKYNSTAMNATTIEFDREIEIEKGKKPEFELTLTLKKGDTTVLPKTLDFSIAAVADVTAEDKEGNVLAGGNKTISTNSFGTFTLLNKGTVTVDINVENDNSTGYVQFVNKDKYVVAGAENVSLARVKFFADKEDARIKNIQFNVTTDDADHLLSSLKEVRLVNGEDSYSASIAKATATTVTLTFTDIETVVKQGSAQYLYLVADYNSIDPNSSNGTTFAGTTVTVDDIVTANTRYIGVDSSLDLVVPASAVDSKVTTVVANVPAEITLAGEDNGNITAAGDYKLATLTIKPEAQTSNKDAQGEILKATLNKIKVKFGTSAGVAATYSIKKVGGTNSVTLTSDTLTTVGGAGKLDTEAKIEANGTTFEIWANVTNVGSRADGATFNLTIEPMTTDVELLDGMTKQTFINVADGVSTRLNATTGK